MRRSYSSSLISVVGFSIQMPAELTRMSRWPWRATVSATRRSHSATTETSPSTTECSLAWPFARARAAAASRHGLRPGRVPAADGHAHALLREAIDDGLAEARGAAGDEGHLAVQSAHVSSYWAA